MEGTPIENRRILVIDDEQEILNFIEIHLVNSGFEVFKASDGQEALDHVKANYFDLVLSDLRLPDIDGVELMQAIHSVLPGVPTIIMTAYGTIENAVDAMRQGAYDYLTKPMSIQDLMFRITKALEFADLQG